MATLDALSVIKLLGRSVPLLLLAKLILILASALSAHGAPTPTLHALLVLMVLPVILEVLLSMLACARLAGMEMLHRSLTLLLLV
jgi:hypothetical protein